MTKAESEFLSILKNAVHPEPAFVIESPDWNGIVNTAKKQNLFPLIFDASSSLPGYEEIEPIHFDSVAAQMSIQAQQTADFLSLPIVLGRWPISDCFERYRLSVSLWRKSGFQSFW